MGVLFMVILTPLWSRVPDLFNTLVVHCVQLLSLFSHNILGLSIATSASIWRVSDTYGCQ